MDKKVNDIKDETEGKVITCFNCKGFKHVVVDSESFAFSSKCAMCNGEGVLKQIDSKASFPYCAE